MGKIKITELGLVITAKEENSPKIQKERILTGDKTGKTRKEVKNKPLINPRVIVVIMSYSIGIKIGIKRNKNADETCFFLKNPIAKTTKGKIPIQAVVMGKAYRNGTPNHSRGIENKDSIP